MNDIAIPPLQDRGPDARQCRAADRTGRPLGAFEQLFWLMDQNRPAHFVVAARIRGTAPETAWHTALHLVQSRHPILSARIEACPGRVPRFLRASDAPVPLRVVRANDGDPELAWETEMAEELSNPIDPTCAPLMRAVLIQGRQDAILMCTAHHAIADGHSLCYVVRDTLKALAGAHLEPLPFPWSQEEALGLTPRESATRAAGEEQPPQLAPPDPSSQRARLAVAPMVKGLRLPRELSVALRKRARHETTTVHGALCAALLLVGRQGVCSDRQHGPVSIVSPIETRTLLGSGDACAMHFTIGNIQFDGQTRAFWDLARGARRQVAAAKTREGVRSFLSGVQRLVGPCFDVTDAANFAAAAATNEAMLTNLGELSFDSHFEPFKLEALWLSVGRPAPGAQVIGAATTHETLCLTHTSVLPRTGLLEAMRETLEKACLP